MVINDYVRARSLFAETDMKVFKKGMFCRRYWIKYVVISHFNG